MIIFVYRIKFRQDAIRWPAFRHPHFNKFLLSSRFRETAKLSELPSNIAVEDVVFDAIQDSTIGDTASTADFIRKYGSHYIASYITGNSLYQVR